jgi:hypothetical protein
MKKIDAFCSLRRTRLALLLLTVGIVSASLLPAPSAGITCCMYSYTVTYYSEPEHTNYVGRCYYNEACTSDIICSGQQTGYYTVGPRSCCPHCGA